MNADAFRHLYGYHFAENRKLWEYITPLSWEQFTQGVNYSHGSARSQLIHLIEVDDIWFSQLKGIEPFEPMSPIPDSDDRQLIRAYRDRIEQKVSDYLANLRDDMLFEKPFPNHDEDKDLITWQVLIHAVNHGTDHRAQMLRLLNDLGVKTSWQDYVFYCYGHRFGST